MRENKDGINVIRTYIYAAPNKGFFRRIISYLSFMFSSIIQGLFRIGCQDVIIASSPQFFVGIAGWVISKIKRIPFIFEVRDLWPESIVQLGQLKNKVVIRLLERIEIMLYHQAAKIILVTDSSVDILVERGVPKSKIAVIKNGVDLKLFASNESPLETKRRMGYPDKFIISYIGTHGLSHSINTTLDAAAKLQTEYPDILFLLVGEGAEKENLKRKVVQEKIKNVIFVDQISKNQLPDYYNMSDIVLVTLRKLPLFRHVIPSKIFEIMAMKKTILLAVDGEVRDIIESAKAGLFCPPEDADALRHAIIRLYQDRNSLMEYGENGRKYVERYFNREQLAEQYLEIVKDVVSPFPSSN